MSEIFSLILQTSQRKPWEAMRYSSSGRLSVKCQGQLQTKVLTFPIQCFFYRFAFKSQWVLGRSGWTSILSSFLSISLPNFPQVAVRGHSACVRRWKFWSWFYHWRSQTSRLCTLGLTWTIVMIRLNSFYGILWRDEKNLNMILFSACLGFLCPL